MYVKIAVLVAGILQIPAAAYLSIGTFENAERILSVFIQPAGWAFSIWGLIYTLSIIYAVYQMIPKYDSQILAHTRVPALVGFTGSSLWLYFAGMTNWLVWLTIPILFVMALTFIKVVTAAETNGKWQNILSRRILLPYAAWTAIASWVNVQALLVERQVVTDASLNLSTNLILFVSLVAFTMHYFKKSEYSPWYGGVMVWASVAVVFANWEGENWLFVGLAGLFALVVSGLLVKKNLSL